jgi:PAS domain S-box-containing protein
MYKELRILILEDVPLDAELEEHELRKSGLVFTSKIVDTKEAFQESLDEFSPDLILSDYELPSFNGLEALRIAQGKCPDVPFILVSGKVGEEFAIEKLKEGATDYVLKGNLKRLVPSVKRALEEAKQIIDRKRAEEKMHLRTEELSGLHMISKEITTKLLMEKFVHATLDGILKVLHPDLVYFFLRNGERLNLIDIAPESSRPGFEIPEHRVGECMCGLAITSGKALYSSDINKDVRCTWDECKKAGFHSFAAVPLWADSEIVGLIGLASKIERIFESEAEYIETVASQISAGLQNALLYKRLKDQTRQLEMEVTERKKAQESLIVSEAKFRLLAEESPNMIFINYKGRVVYANKKCEEIMGYTRDEFYAEGFDFRSLIAPEYLDLVSSSFQKHMQGEEVLPYEYLVVTKDGKRLEVIISTKLINYENDKAILGIITDITERKQTEETIRSEMKFTETLLDSLPGIFYLYEIDPESPANSRLIRFNKKHSTLTGYTPEELEGMTLKDWFEPNTLEKVVRVIKIIGKKGEAHANFRLRMKDGSQVPYMFTARLLDIDGKMYFLGMGIDISDLVRSKEALQESEGKYRNLVENINDVLYSIDMSGVITYIGPSLKTHMGYNPSDVIGKSFTEFVYKEDLPRILQQFQKVLSGILEQSEYRIVTKNGGIRWIHTSSQPILENGQAVGLRGVMQDITERKQAEEELRISEEKFSKAFRASPDAVTLTEMESGRILDMNDGFRNVFGYSREEAIGRTTLELGLYKDPADRNMMVQTLREQGNVRNLELTGRHKYGGELIAQLSVEKIEMDGKSYLITTARDITERKKTEELLQKSEQGLKQKLRELEDFYNIAVGRELRMIELKEQIEELKEELAKYKNQ